MSDGRKKIIRAGKFFLAWLFFTGLVLTVGGWLGGWVAPTLFFITLFTVAAPWSIGILVALLAVTVLVIAGWAVMQYYANTSEEVVVAPEAQQGKEEVQVEIQSDVTDTSSLQQISQDQLTLFLRKIKKLKVH